MDRRLDSSRDLHPNPAPHVLVQWSGGVESTSLLLHFLRDTSCQVTVHYVRMITSENRWPCEDAAIKRLRPLLRAVRHFNFGCSELKLLDGKGLSEDAQFQFPICLIAARHHSCERIYRAYCLEDNWLRNLNGNLTKRTVFNDRHMILQGYLYAHENLDRLCPTHYYYGKSKAWHWHNLGDLAPLTWSCRRPVHGNECGTCHSCLQREAAQRGTSNIQEVADTITRNPDA